MASKDDRGSFASPSLRFPVLVDGPADDRKSPAAAAALSPPRPQALNLRKRNRSSSYTSKPSTFIPSFEDEEDDTDPSEGVGNDWFLPSSAHQDAGGNKRSRGCKKKDGESPSSPPSEQKSPPKEEDKQTSSRSQQPQVQHDLEADESSSSGFDSDDEFSDSDVDVESVLIRHPADFVRELWQNLGIDTDAALIELKAKFTPRPSNDRIRAYTVELSEAVRNNDLPKVKALHEASTAAREAEGAASFNCLEACNRFGDGLLNIASRRGHVQLLRYLVEEALVNVYTRDDLQRTPLHDALWQPKPNFELVEILLKRAPELALLPDARGDTPFEYVPDEHWEEWIGILAKSPSVLYPNGILSGFKQICG